MSTPTEMAERHRAALTELAELGMALAREAQGRAMEASEDKFAELSLAFQRLSRSVRQTFALEARLEREQARAERAAQDEAASAAIGRLIRKRERVRNALTREIWNEYEEDEAEALCDDLAERLSDLTLAPEEFEDAPIEACIERLRADLGLGAANSGDPGDDPGGASAPEVVIWRSSG